PAESATVIAYAEKGIVARVKSCKAHWCRLETSGYEGWAPQETLWGAYPGEEFE
ncbi:MAG: hypothetical protein CVT71_02645, partial [Alphaproteobacteria bacterium HGW-Alphaproteobacteria-10]